MIAFLRIRLALNLGRDNLKAQVIKIPLFLSIFFYSCTGMHDSEEEKRKQQNAKAELISRKHEEVVYIIPPIQRREREKYPWEVKEGD